MFHASQHRKLWQRVLLICSLSSLIACSTNTALHYNQSSNSSDLKRIVLVGDSTMATKSGYGDALCAQLKVNVECINLARGGRSSGSFRAEGLWNQVEQILRNQGERRTWVLIQFGHNDQPGKPGRSTDLVTEFPVNMARYVDEVRAWGGIPVLVTPLTRRSFRDGVLENNLLPWAQAIEKIAAEKKVMLLPLNAESYAAVQAMGEAEADTLAVAPPPSNSSASQAQNIGANNPATIEPQGTPKSAFDRTHVGTKGAKFFSTMVLHQLISVAPEWRSSLQAQ